MTPNIFNPYRYAKPIQEFSNSPNATGTQNFTFDAFKGEKIATSSSVLLGITLTDVQWYLYRSGADMTATISCIQAETDGTLVHTFWTKTFNSLSTSTTPAISSEVSTPSTVPLTTDHVVGTLITGSGSGTLHHRYDNTDAFDGSDSTYAGAYSSSTTVFDRAFEMKGY